MATSSAGRKPKGGIARAPTPPAANAIRRHGQPQAKMTLRCRAPRAPDLAGGVATERGKIELLLLSNQLGASITRMCAPSEPTRQGEGVAAAGEGSSFSPCARAAPRAIAARG